MPIKPIDLSLWVTRVKEKAPKAFRLVGRAGDMQSAMNNGTTVCPSLFFLPPSYTAGAVAHATGQFTAQEVNCQVTALYTARHYQDPKRGKAAEQLEVLQEALWSALVGFTPSDRTTGGTVRYVRGQLTRIDAKKAQVWYADTFAIPVQFRNV